MLANGELEQLQKQLTALTTQAEAQESQQMAKIEEMQNAIKEARDAKIHSEALKNAAEAKMKELNVLKNQFVEMFTKVESTNTCGAEFRPVDDGGVLLLHSGDIVVCRFHGQIP